MVSRIPYIINRFFKCVICLSLLFWTVVSYSQQEVNGRVTDSDGLPLPGVNIVVKGTTIGTQSDFDGNFSLVLNYSPWLIWNRC